MEEKKTIVIRADASSGIGVGHVMRMRSLARYFLEQGWQPVLAYKDCPAALRKQIEADAIETAETAATAFFELLERRKPELVVLDGYHFDLKFQRETRQSSPASRLCVVDDYKHLTQYECDCILNQNPSASSFDYGDIKVLAGLDYALIDPKFLEAREARGKSRTPDETLVTLGGGDDHNLSVSSLMALSTKPQTGPISVIVGAANPNFDLICSAADQLPLKIDIYRAVGDMEVRLANARLAVTGGGSTVWEACCVGTPTLALVTVDNQAGLLTLKDTGALQILDLRDVGPDAGSYLQKAVDSLDDAKLAQMSERARNLVDGQGVRRVYEALVTELDS